MRSTVHKPKLLLHIGLEKTGTTSIQFGLASQREQLLKESVLYPLSPGKTNHLKLCVYALDAGTMRNLHTIYLDDISKINYFRTQFETELRNEIEMSQCNRVIMSSEHLSSNLNTVDQIKKLASLLEPIFSKIDIIIYLRRQDSFLLSRYSTSLKAGSSQLFSTETSQFSDMNFQSLLKRWEDVFGFEAITVRWFDRNCFNQGDLLVDFQTVAGLKANLPKITKNPSLDAIRLSFLREFNSEFRELKGKRLRQARNNIVKCLEEMEAMGEKLSLSHDQSVEILSRFKVSNENVIRRYPIKEGPPDLLPIIEKTHVGLLSVSAKQYVKIAHAMWNFKNQELYHQKTIVDKLKARIAKQAGKVFYFRGEYLKSKNEKNEASRMYKKALELDPKNKIYMMRAESL